MLYWLTEFSDGGDFFNLFRYITFRAGGAFFTALVFGFIFGRPLINLLRRRQKHGQPIRVDGPEGHVATKAGTPTMGGLLILISLVVSVVLWTTIEARAVWIVLALTVVAQLFIYVKGYFGVDTWFGFGAAFGFLSCLAMVLFAKGLGFFLKRDEDYYGTGDDDV